MSEQEIDKMTELSFTRIECASTCPDCGYQMQAGEVNEHMSQHAAMQQRSRPASPFDAIIENLHSKGYMICATNIPGLFHVDGPNIWGAELTVNQLIDLASSTWP